MVSLNGSLVLVAKIEGRRVEDGSILLAVDLAGPDGQKPVKFQLHSDAFTEQLELQVVLLNGSAYGVVGGGGGAA